MTMKTKKTLQHIAAVAVVLLTLCLVFAAPVSAKTVELGVDNWGSSTVTTTFTYDEWTGTLWSLLEYETYVHDKVSPILEDGDTLKLPSGKLNISDGYMIVYGNITIEGADDGSTVININQDLPDYRVFQVMNREELSASNETHVIFKNLTIEGNHAMSTRWGGTPISGIVASCYQITLDIENVNFNNLTGDAISAWANDYFDRFSSIRPYPDYGFPTKEDDAGIVINLKNVKTNSNRALIHFDFAPGKKHTTSNYFATEHGYGFVHLNYDATSEFNDDKDIQGNLVYSEEGLDDITYNYKSASNQVILFQGNMRINDNMDITLGSAVAKIGDTYYGTLEEAVLKAKDGETVTLLKEVEIAAPLPISKSITIDGGEDTILITGPADNSVFYLKGEEGLAVTLKNLMVEGKYAVKVGSPKTTLNVDNAILFGYAAVYLRSNGDDNADGSKVIIANSALVGFNDENPPTNDFGTIAVLANNTEISIQNTDVYAIANKTANQSILRFGADSVDKDYANAKVSITGNSILDIDGPTAKFLTIGTGGNFTGISQQIIGAGVTANFNPSAYIASGMEVVQPGDKYLVQKYVDRSSSSSSSVKPEEPEEPEQPEQPEEPVVEPETPAAPGEVVSSTEVTDGGDVTFETPAGEDGTAPAAADDEVKGVVLPTGTEGTVEFVPVSETPAPAGQEENTKRVFEINVPSYKKGEASVIKFQMTVAEIEADGKTAADVALWHFDEETGEWTKLVTSFIIKDGIVYFEAITNDFSPFAIVYADEPAEELPTDQPEEPTETPASPAPVLAVIAALGAAVVLRRK